MKRIVLAAAAILISASTLFAQEKTPVPHMKVQPMFGNQAKTDAQQRADEKFLSSCDKSFSSRAEASNFFMDRGWEFLNAGQTDTAVYRFNLAWLLNPDNHNTYWAFGLVEFSKGNTPGAVGLYERALKIQPKNSLLLSDMAAAHLYLFDTTKKKKHLKEATGYLDRSIAADARNAYALTGLSQVRYHQKKYAEAWDLLHQGRNIDLQSIDYNYLTLLISRMPDPKGMFRDEHSISNNE
jgi:Tfp pilus assembly protein PilF